MLLSCGRGRGLKESDPVSPIEETRAGDEDQGNRGEPALAEDLREDGHEDPAEGEREAGAEVPAGEEEATDQGEAAEDRPEGEPGDGRDLEGATAAGGGGDFDLVSIPAKRDLGGRLGIGGLERGHGGRWKALGVVEGDGGVAGRRGRGCAAAEGGGEQEHERQRRLHGSKCWRWGESGRGGELTKVTGFFRWWYRRGDALGDRRRSRASATGIVRLAGMGNRRNSRESHRQPSPTRSKCRGTGRVCQESKT